MGFDYFSRNGSLLPADQAVVPLSRVEYSYGFGVYETIRVSKGQPLFIEEHCARLMESARIIGLEHNFSAEFVKNCVAELVWKNDAEACNVKLLLIGGRSADEATLDIVCLNPLFPDRQLYKKGAAAITFRYEREYPGAKTLNMLGSYLAYRQAKQAGAYDALLINRNDCITEGTRTNFFGLKDRTLTSPPEQDILPGVTRRHVVTLAKKLGFDYVEREIKLSEVSQFDATFLTSTSSKILPLRQIDEVVFELPNPHLSELMESFAASAAA